MVVKVTDPTIITKWDKSRKFPGGPVVGFLALIADNLGSILPETSSPGWGTKML